MKGREELLKERLEGMLKFRQMSFSYIVAVSFIVGGPSENHRPVASH